MSGFERKTLPNGDSNPKYIDLCDEDKPISGQKFACLSFISPEKVVKQREQFIFDQFVKEWDFTKCITKTVEFMNFLCYKYKLRTDEVMADFQEFTKDEKEKLKESTIEDDFKTFMDQNEDRLNGEFNKQNGFQTSVRGLKVRGVFPTQEEAEMKCKSLRETDSNHDIFVGPIGMWIPWDPDAYKTGRVEFMEEELNQLHHEKMKNEAKAKEEFDNRVKESKKKAIEENIKNAEKSGNKLTQTMSEQGDLVGVRETVDFDSRDAADIEETKKHNEEFIEKLIKRED
jgi:hypothetical protein